MAGEEGERGDVGEKNLDSPTKGPPGEKCPAAQAITAGEAPPAYLRWAR